MKLKPRKLWAHPERMIMLPKKPTGKHAETGPFYEYLVIPLVPECVDLLANKLHKARHPLEREYSLCGVTEEMCGKYLAAIGIKAPKSAPKKGAKRT